MIDLWRITSWVLLVLLLLFKQLRSPLNCVVTQKDINTLHSWSLRSDVRWTSTPKSATPCVSRESRNIVNAWTSMSSTHDDYQPAMALTRYHYVPRRCFIVMAWSTRSLVITQWKWPRMPVWQRVNCRFLEFGRWPPMHCRRRFLWLRLTACFVTSGCWPRTSLT